HFNSSFPYVSSNVLKTVPREMAADILYGGARLYNFGEEDFKKADAAMANWQKSKAGAPVLG
ncbi:MAG: hypothetical protein IH860_09705, partial [Chloroflexi bacterium]|nr:hypothetical protein [Chloroflexota bacterium]